MNDLFSSSFRHPSDNDDLEKGGAAKEGINLDTFFEDVEDVKAEMKLVEKLYKQLQDSNEQSKSVHNAKTVKEIRGRMDRDVEQVLKKVKVIKGNLEALERSNASSRNVPGWGPGSSADRTRTGVVSGLGKKLKDLMDDFQGLRARMQQEYKETVERRYFTITGEKPSEELVENLIASGKSENFLQKAIQDQGRGKMMDTISEIQERHDSVKEIEKSLIELHQVFLDMAALVESQAQHLNSIENQVAYASSFVKRGTEELHTARKHQKITRKWTCIALFLGLALILSIVIPLIKFFPHIIKK